MNGYSQDAFRFLQRVATNIDKEMSDELTTDSVLWFAFGMERLLKGILYDLNPVYVYEKQDFKNTVGLLYKGRILPGPIDSKEIEQNPNGDVLTFRASLLRVKAISTTASNYSATLFNLADARDIIAHRLLADLDLTGTRVLLARDFYPLMKSYSTELNVPIEYLIGGQEIKLATISAPLQKSLAARIAMKLDSHRMRWASLGKTPGYVEKFKIVTEKILRFKNRLPASCPVCNNLSILEVKVDPETIDGEDKPIGIFVVGFQCMFCKLHITEYDEIDYLKLSDQALVIPDERDGTFITKEDT